MSIKIGIITTKYLHNFFENSLTKINPNCEWEIFNYENFKQIPEIFIKARDNVDGFIVSGNIIKEIIQRTDKEYSKPILVLSLDLKALYQFLLNQLLQNRDLDINRLLIDFFISINKTSNCSMLLDTSFYNQLTHENSTWFKNASLDELFLLEEKTKAKIKQLYDENKADLFVCFYSSLIGFYEDNKIPYVLAFPDLNNVSLLIENFIYDIGSRNLNDNKPAVIIIKKKNLDTDYDKERSIVSIQKCVLDYNHEKMCNFLVKRADSGVEIYANKSILDKITKQNTVCELNTYLEKKLEFKVYIGYGLGDDIVRAQNNAIIAIKNSIAHGKSYVVDENQHLIGPLNTEQVLTISTDPSDKIKYIAKISKLSTLTIEKLLYVIEKTGSNQISVNDVVMYLGGTIRNANRILNNLEKSGLATVSNTKSNLSTGRPVKIYSIDKELCSN